jgi:hypothetical protein
MSRLNLVGSREWQAGNWNGGGTRLESRFL